MKRVISFRDVKGEDINNIHDKLKNKLRFVKNEDLITFIEKELDFMYDVYEEIENEKLLIVVSPKTKKAMTN